MTKQEFLLALNDELGSLSGEERSAAIKYYSDYIEDAGPENLQDVLAELGSPAQVAASILSDFDLSDAEKNAQCNAKNSSTAAPEPQPSRLPIWAVALLVILLAPAWMPVLGVCFGAVMTIFGLLIALFAATAGLLVAGLGAIFGGMVLMFSAPMGGMLIIASGCAMAAFGILGTILCVFVCRTALPAAFRFAATVFRRIFAKRKGTQA